MPQSGLVVVSGAVEGSVDEAALRRLAREAGIMVGPVHGKKGKNYLQQKISGFNNAARFAPWVVLADLDHDADCAPLLRSSWLPSPADGMCLRIAVREVEAWFLADPERLSGFLGLPASRVPSDPEEEPHPKRTMVGLAGQSSRQAIREDMVPRPGSGRPIGRAYTSRLIEFVNTMWRPEVAARTSDSLRRCLKRLRELAEARK